MRPSALQTERPFDVFIPARGENPARKIATVKIKVRIDEDGDEVLTPESSDLIERTQARYFGLLTGPEIKDLRLRLNLTQNQLSELIGCGGKSLSRWENGRGYPTPLVNTILRALDENMLTPANLHALQQPRGFKQKFFTTNTNIRNFVFVDNTARPTYLPVHYSTKMPVISGHRKGVRSRQSHGNIKEVLVS